MVDPSSPRHSVGGTWMLTGPALNPDSGRPSDRFRYKLACAVALLGGLMLGSMPEGASHQSDSHTQREAEEEILAGLAASLGVVLAKPERVALSGGVFVEVDAATSDMGVVVEAYARQGRLKGAQPKKIAQDVLKLALLKREPGWERTRTIIAFASHEARNSISGWLARAAAEFGVELFVVEVSEELRARILDAQRRQVMANADLLADDLVVQTDSGR